MSDANTVIAATKPYLSREEAAAYIGFQPQTLALWASSGKYSLPMVKIGRAVRYRRADLDKWLESHVVGAAE